MVSFGPRDGVDKRLVGDPYGEAFDHDGLSAWRGDDVSASDCDGISDVRDLSGGNVPFPAEAGVSEIDLSGFVSSD